MSDTKDKAKVTSLGKRYYHVLIDWPENLGNPKSVEDDIGSILQRFFAKRDIEITVVEKWNSREGQGHSVISIPWYAQGDALESVVVPALLAQASRIVDEIVGYLDPGPSISVTCYEPCIKAHVQTDSEVQQMLVHTHTPLYRRNAVTRMFQNEATVLSVVEYVGCAGVYIKYQTPTGRALSPENIEALIRDYIKTMKQKER